MKWEVTPPRAAFVRAEACGAAPGTPRWRALRLAPRRRRAAPPRGGVPGACRSAPSIEHHPTTFEAPMTTNLQEVRARFARDQGLPFAESLSELSILDALDEHGVKFRDRLFNPFTTIWGFLSQVLSEDKSCRDAVSRIIAHRAASGLEPCSPNAASYCNARSRLPTAVLRALARSTAEQLQEGLPQAWLWNGRNVFIADGSHVS